MIHLELSEDEAGLLRVLLESKWEEVLKEVRHTDHREFRDLLKLKAATIEHLLDRLTAIGVQAR
jgi:hypothetical protein